MSTTEKYPIDTSREERRRSIRRICSIGEMPISTPHAAATTASPVTIMTLPLDAAPGLGGPCSPADLVRGASTTTATVPGPVPGEPGPPRRPGAPNLGGVRADVTASWDDDGSGDREPLRHRLRAGPAVLQWDTGPGVRSVA